MTDTEVFIRVIYDLFLLSFLFSLFGGYKGAPPPYSTFLSCLKSLIRHPSFCFFFGLKDCRPLIEPFRGDEKKGIEPLRSDGQGDGGGVQG